MHTPRVSSHSTPYNGQREQNRPSRTEPARRTLTILRPQVLTSSHTPSSICLTS